MKLRTVLTFTIIVAVFIAANFYVGWNGLLFVRSSAAEWHPALYWIPFWIVAFSYLIGRARMLPGAMGRLLKVIGSYYFALFEFAVLLLPLADLAGWLLKRSGAVREVYVGVVGTVVLLLIAALMVWGSRNAWSPVVRSYSISVPKSAEGRETLRIAVASDIHLGNVVGNRHIGRLLDKVEGINPDLILLPGDVIDDSIEPFVRNRMADSLARLKELAPLGVYAVLGNHEYYGGHIEEYVKRMAEIGIRVLRDETVALEGGIQIAGRKDKAAESMDQIGRKPVAEMLAGLDKAKPIILLDHQPYAFSSAAEAGADVMLSGHTHRGQFAPNHWITRRLFELDWGYMRKNGMHVIVSSGFGTWGPPIRLASRSEVIDLAVEFRK